MFESCRAHHKIKRRGAAALPDADTFLLIGSEDAVSLIFTLEPSQPVKWASPIPALALPNYLTSAAKWRAVTIRVA
jgi:hypothetical protein